MFTFSYSAVELEQKKKTAIFNKEKLQKHINQSSEKEDSPQTETTDF